MDYQNILNEIEQIKKQVTALGSLNTDQKKKISYKFRLEWNYNSNSMEGNTLTIDDTKEVMVGNISVQNKPFKDIIEMQGHDKVVEDILRIGKAELRLSEKRIKEIHTSIMYEENDIDKDKIGKWKTGANYILNYKSERYDFVAPDEVPEKIHDLLNRTNADLDAFFQKKKKALHPITIALQFHLDYLAIHPFYDGNGRTARILTNLILVACGYNPFWIDEKDRKIYYSLISDIQGYGADKEPFFEHCAQLIKRSEQIVLDVAEGKEIAEESDLDKEITLLAKKWKGKNVSKSPKLIYDVFHFTETNLIAPCEIVLRKFDTLFQEKKIVKKVNGSDKKRTIFDTIKLPSFGVIDTSKTIYGFDIYENDIYSINYQYNQYGLSNAKYDANLLFEIELQFETQNYSISIKVGYQTVFGQNFAYGELPEMSTLKELPQKVATLCLEDIKQKGG